MYTKNDPLELKLIVELLTLKSESDQIALVRNLTPEILNQVFSTAIINGLSQIVTVLSPIVAVCPAADTNDAIQEAAQYGQLEVLKILCNLPNIDPIADYSDAICLAAQKNHLETVQFLCTRPNIDFLTLKNAILAAEEHKHQKVANFLVSLPCCNPFNAKIDLEKKNEIITLLTKLKMQKQLDSHQAQSNRNLKFLFFKEYSNIDILGDDLKVQIFTTALALDYYSPNCKM